MKSYKRFVANALVIFLGLQSFNSSCQGLFGRSITGNGHMVKNDRNVSAFSSVENSGSIDVVLTQGDQENVRVEGDENVVAYVKTTVRNGVLSIHFEDRMNFNNVNIRVFVQAKDLKVLSNSGSGDISSNGTLRMRDLAVHTSGSGNVALQIETEKLECSVSGSSDVKLKGSTGYFKAHVSGSGSIKAIDLKSRDCNAATAGSGEIQVFVSGKLKAVSSGSGSIEYGGNPQSKDIASSGSGEVKAY